jgi:hypothetical protein
MHYISKLVKAIKSPMLVVSQYTINCEADMVLENTKIDPIFIFGALFLILLESVSVTYI